LKGLLLTRYNQGPDIHDRERHTVKNGCMNDSIHQGDINFIREEGRLRGECYATQIVGVLMKYDLRDEEKDAVDLPSHYMQRRMYERYCYENGWLTKSDNRVRYPPLAEYEKRNVDDVLWEANVATTEVVAWWTF
jgi:hypothetical protein